MNGEVLKVLWFALKVGQEGGHVKTFELRDEDFLHLVAVKDLDLF